MPDAEVATVEPEIVDAEIVEDPPAEEEPSGEELIAGFEVINAGDTLEPNSILLFGHPKRGKSTLAGSIADVDGFNKVLHIDLERGSAPLARRWPNIKVVRPRDVNGVIAIVSALVNDEYALGYDAVILDTFSTLGKWFKREWIDDKKPKSGKMDFDGWDMWGETAMDLMWDLHNMYAVGISVYHSKTETSQADNKTWTTPFIQGSARYSVASVPDMVLHLDINGRGERVLQMVPKSNMMTGSRYEDVLPENLTNASMPELYSAIWAV